ncbi:TetR/AcrR family transcriptional regulator [Pseudoduganella lutea]|uniref:TetR/AcrR family transcriptional regulator n=1 Tax=Pseudoduganella lutea TaxID=321985 RepID=A0A4P6L5Y3_9BURK|nr:TetR/AcrR family transcriptional regulator [Pseudoduganella lutea]QBE66957.1 TetR/AcrR family transcriptional regulator [Pseudoduganella lutea]
MRVSREQAAQNRERIVDTAARLFREKGADGIGVADLMKAAGLTHGGFYGHFDSKEALLGEAASRALDGAGDHWQAMMAQQPGDALGAVVRSYLSPAHRDNPGQGCAISALGADISRAGPAVRDAVTARAQAQFALLAAASPGSSDDERRRHAIATYAAMVGAMVLARAVSDEALSQEILAAVTATLVAPPA